MIIYGKQVCRYAIERHPKRIERIYLQKRQRLSDDAYRRFADKVTMVDARKAQAMSRGGNHQGILIELIDYETVPFSSLKSGDFLVVLDGLTDVGNIGAIIRTAYALGVEGVIATGVKQLNFSAIARTSAGALLDMPVAVVSNVADVLNELGQVGFVRYGAAMDGDAVETVVFSRRRVLVLGSEGEGLSKKALSKIDDFVSVTMRRPFDSLNVHAAAAIILYRMSYATE
jgi:23S rRNA (guanosine2251-2'-O)-methyltransferase